MYLLKIVAPGRALVILQASQAFTVVEVIDVTTIDAELDLNSAPDSEGRHLDVAGLDMLLELSDDLRTKTSSKRLRIDTTALSGDQSRGKL